MMEQLEKEFTESYSRQFDTPGLLPAFITDKFLITACLNETGKRNVYVVASKQSGQKYILKKMSRQLSSQSEAERDMLTSLNHPAIPKVCTWYEDEEYTYLIRDYFEGVTLESRVLGRGPLPEGEIRHLGLQICDLLAYLHSQTPPVIHRDIKPQNIVLRPNGTIGLIDFDASRRYNTQATNDTVYLGTTLTAAPEQFGYGQTDQHTDIYSLGVLLIYLATGRYDRSGLTGMTPWLRKVAATCTEFSPKDRYETVDAARKHFARKNRAFSLKRFASYLGIFVLCLFVAGGIYYLADHFAGSLSTSQKGITFENQRIEQAVRDAL